MKKSKNTANNCDTCEFYNYDENLGENVCTVNLDEDEYYRMMTSAKCPFYKYYNEYKSVQKQN